MKWRVSLVALCTCLALGACGGGGGGYGGPGGVSGTGVSFDVDLAGNLRALPQPTMGALEAL